MRQPHGRMGTGAKVRAGVAAAMLAAAIFSVAHATAGTSPRPKRLQFKESYCVSRRDHASVVRFRARDRVRLLGVMLGKGPVGVALGHEVDGTLCNWMPFARILARSGYRVLAFDFRNSGGSSGHVNGGRSQNFDLDFLAAAGVLRAAGSTHVMIAGASFGGTAALTAAAEASPALSGVAELSAPAVWSSRLDANAAVKKLGVPVLFMAAAGDTEFVGDSRTLYDEAAAADKQLQIVPGSSHGTLMLGGRAGRGPRATLLGFIRAHAG